MSGISNLPDYLVQVGFGLIPGVTRVTALGNNPDVDIASLPEDIWSGGGAYPWMTAATALEIVSDSVNDTAAGTGARTVSIVALDINYVPVTQVMTLNGTMPVAIPSNAFRINVGLIASAGSGGVNAGTLTIRDAGGGTTRAIIPATYGITRQSIYTVPAGFTLQIVSEVFGFNEVAGGNKFARFATFVQTSTGFHRMPFELAVGDEPPFTLPGLPGIQVNEKTDFCIRCTSVSNDNVNLTAAWLGVQRRNA